MEDSNKSLLKLYFSKIDELRDKVNNLNNSKYKSVLLNVLDNMQKVMENYFDFFGDCFNDEFRYFDYFSGDLDVEEIIPFFDSGYKREDYNERLPQFIMYCLLKYLEEIFVLYEDYDFSELCEILDVNNYYKKLTYLSSELLNALDKSKWNTANQKKELPFLDNRFKVFFAGLSLEDIEELDPNFKMQFITQLENILSKEVVVPNAEPIGRIKDTYGFPIQRVKLSYHYRVAFVRYKDVTVILGITMKTGKDIDYNRYGVIGKHSQELYRKIEEFIDGKTPLDDDHFKVLEILKDTYNNESNNSKK